MQFLVDGIDKSVFVVPDTLAISSTINGRNTVSVDLIMLIGEISDIGEEVIIKDDAAVKIFGGLIAKRSVDSLYTTKRKISLDACDYSRYCDRKTLAAVYENKTQGYIIADVIARKLATYGVTLGFIEPGVNIEKTSYNYMKVSAILDELAAINGMIWWIDYDKAFNFHSRTEFLAPFNLSDLSRPFKNLTIEKTDDQYRNRQYLRAGLDITDLRTETFKGNGQQRTFNLGYPADLVTSIKINGTPVSFGIKEYDEGKAFYWQRHENELVQDQSGIVLSTTCILSVAYTGFYPILVMAQDDDEVTERLSVEGLGDGIYEEIEADESIDSRDLAFLKANSILQYYGKIQTTIKYSTFKSGLLAGMLQNVVLLEDGLDGDFLITSVNAREYGPNFIYEITAVDGENFGGWLDFFKRLGQTGKKYLIREDEVFVILRRSKDKLKIADSISKATPAYAMGEVGEDWYIGYEEVGTF